MDWFSNPCTSGLSFVGGPLGGHKAPSSHLHCAKNNSLENEPLWTFSSLANFIAFYIFQGNCSFHLLTEVLHNIALLSCYSIDSIVMILVIHVFCLIFCSLWLEVLSILLIFSQNQLVVSLIFLYCFCFLFNWFPLWPLLFILFCLLWVSFALILLVFYDGTWEHWDHSLFLMKARVLYIFSLVLLLPHLTTF